MCLVAAHGDRLAAQVGNYGTWEPAFNHEFNTANTNQVTVPPGTGWPVAFNAIHMALVPVGPHRGKVLVWHGHDGFVQTHQPWAYVNPYWPAGGTGNRFDNSLLTMPQGQGDLFCAGHAWTKEGWLFVAGGTTQYPPGPFHGGILVYLFNPNPSAGLGDWNLVSQVPNYLVRPRWYPTVTLNHDDRMIVSGGYHNGTYWNDYEAYTPGVNPTTFLPDATPDAWLPNQGPAGGNPRLYRGPPILWFGNYPRLHLLSNGEIFAAGDSAHGFRWQHDAAWDPVTAGLYQSAGTVPPGNIAVAGASAVLFPNTGGILDRVARIGGAHQAGAVFVTRDDVEIVKAAQTAPWQLFNRLNVARFQPNAVILPSGQIFVFGGKDLASGQPVNTPELLVGSTWIAQPDHAGPREYHAAGVLLPDGRVGIGGGENRLVDYQIYRPPYLAPGVSRPLGVATNVPQPPMGSMQYRDAAPGALYLASWTNVFEDSVWVDKIVLIAPGSVTHHSDMHQRYIELTTLPPDDGVDPAQNRYFLPPKNSKHAPRGWYMLFLVTNEGAPSDAAWVYLN